MTGWKTWAAGIGSIVSGVGMIIVAVSSDPINGELITSGIALIIAGLGLLGIGHKIEKSR
jgi:hypothetical protein